MDRDGKQRKWEQKSFYTRRNPLQENVDRVQISKPKAGVRPNRSSSAVSLKTVRSDSKPKRSTKNVVGRKPFTSGSLIEEKKLKKGTKIASCVSEKKLRKGLVDSDMKLKSLGVDRLCKRRTVLSEKSTPVVKGRLFSGKSVFENGDCGNIAGSVKTPPVEASISPEIQFQLNSKMAALTSGVQSVCYGTGHLLSGVTDKRKCRRRGSLRGAVEKPSICSDSISQNSLVPLLGEASVRWLDDSVASDCVAETVEMTSFSTSSRSPIRDDCCLNSNSGRNFGPCSSVETMSLRISWQGSSVDRTNGSSLFDSCCLSNDSIQHTSERFRVETEKSYLGSWESDDTVVEHQLRISWKDKSVDATIGTDEFGGCCLSNEGIHDCCHNRFRVKSTRTLLGSLESDPTKSVDTTIGSDEFDNCCLNAEVCDHSYDRIGFQGEEIFLGSWECDATLGTSWQDNSVDATIVADESDTCCLSNEKNCDHEHDRFSVEAKETYPGVGFDENTENLVRLDDDLTP